MLERRFRHVEERKNVSAKSSLELGGTDIFDPLLRMLLGSVINQDVQPPKLKNRFLHSVLTKLFVAYISGYGQAATVFTRHQSFSFLGILMFIEVDNNYVRTFLRKGYSDCTADSAVSAGDQRYLAFELLRTMSSTILCARPRLHLILKARLAILLLPRTRRLFFLLGHVSFAPTPTAVLLLDRSKPHAEMGDNVVSQPGPTRHDFVFMLPVRSANENTEPQTFFSQIRHR